MGVLRNLILGDPEDQGMQYRIRVFDHGHSIKTATVKNRGQDFISLVVKGKDYFILGEEVKLAFIINPEITPKYFGNIAEIDFDVRDSTQLGDLLDLCPDLVARLNRQLYDTHKALRKDDNVIEAEFKEKTEKEGEEKEKGISDESLIALTDPKPEKIVRKEPEKSDLEKAIEKIPGVRPVTHTLDVITSIPHNVHVNIQAVNRMIDIHYIPDDSKKQQLIKDCLAFCAEPGNQKCLRWLPKYLKIEPEISAIVSQMELDGVGIMPMYYVKQSGAEIAEKILQRPKVQEDWKILLVYAVIALGILMLVVFFILKLAGKV
jgi:hypothetical protein